MRILVAGDWHGNRGWAEEAFAVAAERDCETVLQLGDFGLWPGREEAWLDHVDGLAARAGAHLVWIDGNHENHDSLDRWREKAGADGMVEMRDHVTWAPRGVRWDWAGVRFGALGGAVSIDRFLRREGVNWWAQEVITQSDVDRLGDAELDVLVTHTSPTTARVPLRPLPAALPEDIIADAKAVRSLLDQAVERTRPKLVLHGHLHARLTWESGGRRVEGLAHDKSSRTDALAVLDLDKGAALRLDPVYDASRSRATW